MPTYVVSGYLTISVSKRLQAKSKAEARRLAEDLSAPSLCHQCSCAGQDDEQVWQLNGFDDPPEDAVQEVEKL